MRKEGCPSLEGVFIRKKNRNIMGGPSLEGVYLAALICESAWYVKLSMFHPILGGPILELVPSEIKINQSTTRTAPEKE